MNFNQSLTTWYEVLCAPEGLAVNEAYADRTAINSVAIITEKSWQELCRSLIEQAHFRCNLPSYKTCITDMLRANGFKPVHDKLTLRETVKKLNAEYDLGKSYIVKLSGGGYYALVPDPNRQRYAFKGCRPASVSFERRKLGKLWVYIPGTDNRTWITRTTEPKRKIPTAQALERKNENPDGRLIGDCAVRAVATVLECSWHDAVDVLAQTANYEDPTINSRTNINNTLMRMGFIKLAGIASGKKFVTGTQICQIFDQKYKNGERIFAYLGNHHCAAIIPMGAAGYKIQDTWDSTERQVIEYWVRAYDKKEIKPSPEQIVTEYKVGAVIWHPVYGNGVVNSITNKESREVLEIFFDTVGVKKINAEWLRKNT